MNSAEIRQSFLDFFASKQHRIVDSASLMPTSPNLLFTNAGMNPFVPYFLGDRASPNKRVADTQKCIRAGGKHNDLDDVGLDTYHQTFFEMLGNWSFGDYFKEEAIKWAWELLTQVWKFPKERLYVTVYKPESGDPSKFDQEAYDFWKSIFEKEGMDPEARILYGNKKDNFWMMGDTGPCGPCSEIHVDLTPNGDTNGSLVNQDSPYCIEIWNLVFMQFNAEEDGTFSPLKSTHVDTGMGFERICGIVGTTKNFTDFSQPPSNYNCDLFSPIFDKISNLCGKKYDASLPENSKKLSDLEAKDVAFRVLADHIRTLSCSIADGILPGNEGRNYVLRRILRRAVMYGRKLDLPAGFFTELVEPVITVLSPVFPELKENEVIIRKIIKNEEAAFDRTIDRGIQMLDKLFESNPAKISGKDAFELYDTYGFPLDLTQIIAAEKGLEVDTQAFGKQMESQRKRARNAQQKTVIKVSDEIDSAEATKFVGYEAENLIDQPVQIIQVIEQDDNFLIITNKTPLYAEMGGQLGDKGTIFSDGLSIEIIDTQKDSGGRFLHKSKDPKSKELEGKKAQISVDVANRLAIQRHHTATHILHWALRKVLGTHIKQAGSFVSPKRLRFDFNHFEQIGTEDLKQIERLCNQKIISNDTVSWFETDFDKKPDDVIAFFGEKYGNRVRVVDVGGWSKELCGGTHVKATGEIGLLKITSESAISAGTRRIEAICGTAAFEWINENLGTLNNLATGFSCNPDELPHRLGELENRLSKSERELKSLKTQIQQSQAKNLQNEGIQVGSVNVIAKVLEADNPNDLRGLASKIEKELENGLVVVGAKFGDKLTLVAIASAPAIEAGFKAGDIIRELTLKLGGKGGGKPDFAMGGGSDVDNLDKTLEDWIGSLS